uniref:Plastid lipid-associated protein/fibrillin conserved domain-containing protein n=1 Tax=Zea mays TaxID=4577 RepID=A0A804RIK3_MAIZE
MAGSALLNALVLRAPSPSLSSSSKRRSAGAFVSSNPPRFPSLRSERRVALPRAAAGGDPEDEWVPEPEGGSAVTGTAVAEAPEAGEVAELKAQLKDALYGTERGLRASSESRAKVLELITQLETRNPTPAPTEALTLLNGKWILAYTSFSQLFPLLEFGKLPALVKVEEISQTIDSKNFTVQNCIKFSGPLATTSVSTNAKFEIRSPKRVQVRFCNLSIHFSSMTESSLP